MRPACQRIRGTVIRKSNCVALGVGLLFATRVVGQPAAPGHGGCLANVEGPVTVALGQHPNGWFVPPHEDVALRTVDRQIDAALHTVFRPLRFENAPLEDALRHLREVMAVNLHVCWGALEDVDVPRDTPVTVIADGLPAWRVLRLVLDEAGGDSVALGYEVRDGVLLIATVEWLERDQIVRAYPVRDLLVAQACRWQRCLEIRYRHGAAPGSARALVRAIDAGYREDQARRMSMLGDNQTRPVDENLVWAAEWQLLDLIQQTVTPDAWAENGGMGTVMIYNDVLVARQSRLVHRELGDFLASLRRASAAQASLRAGSPNAGQASAR